MDKGIEALIARAKRDAVNGEYDGQPDVCNLIAALERERKQKNSWKRLSKQNLDGRVKDVSALMSARQRIAYLEKTLRGTEEPLIAASDQISELESAPNGMMQLSNELAEMKRKCAEFENPKFDTAKLINKFYTRYPLESFKSDPERSEALGYYMAGSEVQHFGDFVVYEMPEDDEGSE